MTTVAAPMPAASTVAVAALAAMEAPCLWPVIPPHACMLQTHVGRSALGSVCGGADDEAQKISAAEATTKCCTTSGCDDKACIEHAG